MATTSEQGSDAIPIAGSETSGGLDDDIHLKSKTNHQPEQQPTKDNNGVGVGVDDVHDEEATIQQILHFWNHPSLQQVSPAQKQEYLKNKGITEQEIFKAWDRIVLAESQEHENTNNKKSGSEDWVSSFNQSHNRQQQQQQQQPALQATQQQQQQQQPGMANSSPPYNYNFNTNRPHDHNYNYHQHHHNNHDAYNYEEEDEEGAYSTSNVALIATVGGFVGLMAAATVRWLNGGDFLLFPPPRASSSNNKRILTLNASSALNSNETMVEEEDDEEDGREEEEEEEEEGNDNNDDDDDDEDPELTELLSNLHAASTATTKRSTATMQQQQRSNTQRMVLAITQLTDTFQQHVTVQQRILQKLSSNNNPATSANVTDLSMQALRKHQQQQQQQQQQKNTQKDSSNSSCETTTHLHMLPDPMLWYKLVEIQVELRALKQQQEHDCDWDEMEKKNKTKKLQPEMAPRLQERLEETLARLQTVLDDLKPPPPPQEATTTTKSEEEREERKGPGTDSTEINQESTSDDDEASPSTGTANSTATSSFEDGQAETAASQPESNANSNMAPLTATSIISSTSNDTISDPALSTAPIAEANTTGQTTTTTTTATEAEDEKAQILRQVRTAIINLVRHNADSVKALKAGTQILYLYVSNLSKNPHVPRYRRVFTSNQSYQKVEQLQGGKAFLSALGFVASADNRVLEWPPVRGDDVDNQELTAQDKEALVQKYHLSEVAAALAILKTLREGSAGATEQDATLDLLEKALDVLPCPPPPLPPPPPPQSAPTAMQEGEALPGGTEEVDE